MAGPGEGARRARAGRDSPAVWRRLSSRSSRPNRGDQQARHPSGLDPPTRCCREHPSLRDVNAVRACVMIVIASRDVGTCACDHRPLESTSGHNRDGAACSKVIKSSVCQRKQSLKCELTASFLCVCFTRLIFLAGASLVSRHFAAVVEWSSHLANAKTGRVVKRSLA